MKFPSKRYALTFFDRFHKIVTDIDPAFFKKDLPDDIDEYIKSIESSTPKIKTKSALLLHYTAMMNWHNFKLEYSKSRVERITGFIDELHSCGFTDTMSFADVDGIINKKNRNSIKDIFYKARYDINGEFQEKDMDKLFEFNYDFFQEGKKIFRVEEQLNEELLLTDVSKVDDSFLILPYNTICIHIPYNNAIKIRLNVIRWIYITQWMEDGLKIIEYCSDN